MTNLVLLALTTGFNDMAFLSNDVILTENGCEVITVSKESDAIKGQESSAMTISLEEALSQDVDFRALIIVGGNDLDNWSLLKETIQQFHDQNKIIGGIERGAQLLQSMEFSENISIDDEIIKDNQIITVQDPGKAEKFAETIASTITE